MPELLAFADVPAAAVELVGGKGLSLAETARAGLPVPPGFVVTTEAYRRLHSTGIDSDFREQLHRFYRDLGEGSVAVRSSATAEDGVESSFAGQQETFLGVVGLDDLVSVIERCWKSLNSERAISYRRTQGIRDDQVSMAVAVQKLIDAEIAGVLFTRDPQDETGDSLSIEAAWGLGEAVVSGRLTPDRFTVRRTTGEVRLRQAGLKPFALKARGEITIPPEQQSELCLNEKQLGQLFDLAKRVEAVQGENRDLEWAILDGAVYLLQSRPITANTAADRKRVLQEVRAEAQALAGNVPTVWVRYNLSESLPEPTPMTWAIVRRMLSANGAFGLLNADLGGEPDPALGELGAFDLIAGRPMANLARMPRLQFVNPPLEYPFEAFKKNPQLALDPKPVLNPRRLGKWWLFKLPGAIGKLSKINSTIAALAATFAKRFEKEIVPPFRAEAKAVLKEDFGTKSSTELLKSLEFWFDRALVQFARESLKPTALAEFAWTQLFESLKPKLGETGAKAAVAEIVSGAKIPSEASLGDALVKVRSRTMTRAEFLDRFGHRGRLEMELAQPRWSENPEVLDQLISTVPHDGKTVPTEKQETLTGPARIAAEQLQLYLGWREAAKHYLLLGFAVLRKILLELDRRFQLHGGIFFLEPSELNRLIAGDDLASTIRDRKKQRQIALSLEVPCVVFSDDLDAIGRAIPLPPDAESFSGTALSAGVGEGPALVLHEPISPPEAGYVLVCPSTDPAWVPLFARAKAVVLETGGVLSHGAIVAREFGLPAVAGLPGITKRIRNGERLRVDGTSGIVARLKSD